MAKHNYPKNRKVGRPIGATVERARAALQSRALEYVELHAQAAAIAAKRGNSNPAQWALQHIAAVDDRGKEIRPIGADIDRTVIEGGNRAPTINIGWISAPGSLPEPTAGIVDVTPLALPESEPTDEN